MSILNITSTDEFTTGIQKSIDLKSIPIILNILQKGIYAYPIQSTVRELAINSYDAVVERKIAKAILVDKKDPADFFDISDEEYTSDSGWNPEYYDLAHLSDDDTVYLIYNEGETEDTIIFKDYGIGMWGERLEGYFKVSWSSKRLLRKIIGSYGIGSKAPLALNIPFYTMISVHNGRKVEFNIYMDKFESVTPKFNSNTGKLNKYFLLQNVPIYYTEVDELNGVTIRVPVKKHNKPNFINAIKDQLLYLENISFKIRSQASTNYRYVDIKSKILFKNEYFIVTDNNRFYKPQVLVKADNTLINYGTINFPELGLEDKKGSFGLILDASEIDISPNRETVIWSTRTRNAVLKGYTEMEKVAVKLVHDDLNKEKDYFSWLLKLNTTSWSDFSSDNSLFQRLKSFITINYLSISFDEGLPYITEFPSGLYVRKILSDDPELIRHRIRNISELKDSKIYLIDKANKLTDFYLIEKYKTNIVLISNQPQNKLTAQTILGSKILDKSYDSIIVPESIKQLFYQKFKDKILKNDDDVADVDLGIAKEKLIKPPDIMTIHIPNANKSTGFRDVTTYVLSPKDIDIATIESASTPYIFCNLYERKFLTDTLIPAMSPRTIVFKHSTSAYVSNRVKKRYEDFGLPPLNFFVVSLKNAKKALNLQNVIPLSDLLINYKNSMLKFKDYISIPITFEHFFSDSIIRELFNMDLGYSGLELVRSIVPEFSDNDFGYADLFQYYNTAPTGSFIKNSFFKACIRAELDVNDKEAIKIVNLTMPPTFSHIGYVNGVRIFNEELFAKFTKLQQFIHKSKNSEEYVEFLISSYKASSINDNIKNYLYKYYEDKTFNR